MQQTVPRSYQRFKLQIKKLKSCTTHIFQPLPKHLHIIITDTKITVALYSYCTKLHGFTNITNPNSLVKEAKPIHTTNICQFLLILCWCSIKENRTISCSYFDKLSVKHRINNTKSFFVSRTIGSWLSNL